MRNLLKRVTLAAGCVFAACGAFGQASGTADEWLTTPDRSTLFARQQAVPFSSGAAQGPVIDIDPKQRYQLIDGFGFALTQGSALHLMKMDAAARDKLVRELFGTAAGEVGISYLRVSIGSSDLNERVFSYDDVPEGQTDPQLLKFDLGPDRNDVIPVLKAIVGVNPKIKILGSPWSPPAWMKTTYDTRGGMLKKEFYGAYARYFVKYIRAMQAEGIRIDAITVQNEPLHPGNNPSLLLPAPDEAEFIRDHLGPLFKAEHIDTKIILFDHNADRPDYAISILDDPTVAQYVDGSGFHLYAGQVSALSQVHDAHPDKNLYFTEQMVVERPGSAQLNILNPVRRLIIGATRNWSRNVLEWNLAADPQYKPFTDRGGCSSCQGAITIDKNMVTRNVAYYSVAHASKFVRPGSVRIASNEPEGLPNVAFDTPGGKKVLIVGNGGQGPQTFTIRYNGRNAVTTLQQGAVATYIF